MECLKSDRSLFSGENHFCPNSEKKMLEMSPKQGFSDFLKNVIGFLWK